MSDGFAGRYEVLEDQAIAAGHPHADLDDLLSRAFSKTAGKPQLELQSTGKAQLGLWG